MQTPDDTSRRRHCLHHLNGNSNIEEGERAASVPGAYIVFDGSTFRYTTYRNA